MIESHFTIVCVHTIVGGFYNSFIFKLKDFISCLASIFSSRISRIFIYFLGVVLIVFLYPLYCLEVLLFFIVYAVIYAIKLILKKFNFTVGPLKAFYVPVDDKYLFLTFMWFFFLYKPSLTAFKILYIFLNFEKNVFFNFFKKKFFVAIKNLFLNLFFIYIIGCAKMVFYYVKLWTERYSVIVLYEKTFYKSFESHLRTVIILEHDGIVHFVYLQIIV